MISDKPLASIIMPTRNRIATLDRAIESVKSQDYLNWELIIVVDGSQDFSVIKEQYKQFENIIVVQHPYRMGPGAARNTGLRIASGDYIFYLDDDDLYLPCHVSTLINYSLENDLDFSFSQGIRVFETTDLKVIKTDTPYNPAETTDESMHITNSIPMLSCVHTRACLHDIGFFDEDLKSYEDWDFIIRFIRKKRCGFVPINTYEIHRRPDDANNVTESNKDHHVENYKLIYKRYPFDSDLVQQHRAEVLRTMTDLLEQNKKECADKSARLHEYIIECPDIEALLKAYYIDQAEEINLENLDNLIFDIKDKDLSETVITILIDYLETSSENVEAHLLLGRLLMELNNYQAAIISLMNAQIINQSCYVAVLLHAECLERDGKITQALELIKSVKIEGMTDAKIAYRLLKLHSSMVDSEPSLDYARRLIANADCQSEYVFNHIGNIYFRCQEYSDAKLNYKKAVVLNPAYEDAETNLKLVSVISEQKVMPLFLVLPKGENYGWGVCSSYLRKELKKKTDVFSLEYDDWGENGNKYIPGVVFTSIGAERLDLVYPVKGKINIGYTFFERDLTDEAIENARFFDLVLAGSSWAVEQLKQHGINNCDVLVQGIDETLFYPVETQAHNGFFVFSGGKFELRKSQDLVLKAVGILQQKYSDIILVDAWVNYWPQSMWTMSYSPHIKYEHNGGDWNSLMSHIYQINNLDEDKIITCEIIPHDELRSLFSKTDLGIFPNRSEGGTNLVLMEYMACGKPVIATNCTGHKDIVNSNNSLLLENNTIREYLDDNNEHYATWDEPDLNELVEKIEFAYQHRDQIEKLGKQAGSDLAEFTWAHMAERLLVTLNKLGFLEY